MQHDHEREIAMFGECVTCAAATIPDTVSTSQPLGESAHARRSNPSTSHAAARSLNVEQLHESQRVVLDLFRARPEQTLEELVDAATAAAVRFSASRLRTAACELLVGGVLVDTGRRRATRSGREARVLALVRV